MCVKNFSKGNTPKKKIGIQCWNISSAVSFATVKIVHVFFFSL